MRSTSAPMSASIIAAKGPGPMPATSTMRIPASGPVVPWSEGEVVTGDEDKGGRRQGGVPPPVGA